MTATVIRLPTAAPRKVQQRSIRAVREAKAANPWPGEYRPPCQRNADAMAHQASRSPELLILLALLKTLPAEQRRAIRDTVYRVQFVCGDSASLVAAGLIDSIRSDPA